jgi:NAD(P)-dependent dehydrogenase (short-subunit alcohol dehydrogenase family)
LRGPGEIRRPAGEPAGCRLIRNTGHNWTIGRLPSIIDTPANRAAMPDAKHHRWRKPAQLAAVLAFLVSDDADLISGAAIPVYGLA